MINDVFIISYFGDTPEKITARSELLILEVTWLFEANPAARIHIFWQNSAESMISDSRITYIIPDDPNKLYNAAEARNELLKYIYASRSEIDEFFLMDDDMELKEGSINPFQYIELLHSLHIDFDCLSFISEREHCIRDGNSLLTKNARIWSGFLCLKNFWKWYGFEQYFDTSMNCHQDNDFGLNLIFNGFHVYMVSNPSHISKRGASVMFNGGRDRKVRSLLAKQYMTEKWNQIAGFEVINPNKLFNTTKFENRFGKYPSRILLSVTGIPQIIEQR